MAKDNQYNGSWIDEFGACKVCDGEIPHGHMAECDVHKLQVKERAYNTVLEAYKAACAFIDGGSIRGSDLHVAFEASKNRVKNTIGI